MMKSRLPACLAVASLAWLLTGCDQATLGKNLPRVKNVLLVSVRLHNGSMDETEPVKYPSLNFIGDSFRTNFIGEWNERFGSQLTLKSPTNDDEKLLSPNPPPRTNARRENDATTEEAPIWMRDNLDRRRYPTMETLLDRYGCDAWAVLEGQVSMWGQIFRGSARIHDRSGNLLWKQSFKAVSTYIIKDEASPYLSDFDQLLDTLEKQRSHKSEILLVAGELGRQTVRELHRVWEKTLKNAPTPGSPKR